MSGLLVLSWVLIRDRTEEKCSPTRLDTRLEITGNNTTTKNCSNYQTGRLRFPSEVESRREFLTLFLNTAVRRKVCSPGCMSPQL